MLQICVVVRWFVLSIAYYNEAHVTYVFAVATAAALALLIELF